MRTEEEGVPETLPGSGAEWIVLAHSGRMTPEAQRALQEWRTATAENDVDFRKAESVWKLTGELADDPIIRAELDELRRKAQAREARARRWIPSWRMRLATAATIVLAIAAGTLLVSSRNTDWHEAPRGELNVIKLSDGSSIAVNTESRIGVRYSAARRDLTLERGEGTIRRRGRFEAPVHRACTERRGACARHALQHHRRERFGHGHPPPRPCRGGDAWRGWRATPAAYREGVGRLRSGRCLQVGGSDHGVSRPNRGLSQSGMAFRGPDARARGP